MLIDLDLRKRKVWFSFTAVKFFIRSDSPKPSQKLVLIFREYEDHKWYICAGLKVVAQLTLQSGYTKYCCLFINGTEEAETNTMSLKHCHYVKTLYQVCAPCA